MASTTTSDAPLPDAFAATPTRILRWLEHDAELHTRSAWLFLRALGVVYLVAFASLAVQIHGLVGEAGILPAVNFLDALHTRFGADAYHLWPTLAWLDASNTSLTLMCTAGCVLAVVLILDLAPAPALLGLWVLYLSLSTVGQTFLGFQWDTLLLESGLIALFLAPWRLKPRWRNPEPPPWPSLWLLRWLVFRLMFSSGVVKLTSQDPTWADLTAMSYHYLTQPLPNPISWRVHAMPLWFHKAEAATMFVLELGLPFLVFAPRTGRAVAALGTIGLMLVINITGNYGFFGLLSISLALVLIEDRWFRLLFRRSDTLKVFRPPTWIKNGQCIAAVVLAVMTFPITAVHLGSLFVPPKALPQIAREAATAVSPFRSVNRYGLFAVMTTQRLEIEFEASMDGQTWKPYIFPYKPGPLERRPGSPSIHMPRLDWQMWFAALGDVRHNRWVMHTLVCLLEASPDVLDLIEHNPYPDERPYYVRAVIWRYTFTTPQDRSGAWWQREDPRLYAPVLSQDDLQRKESQP